MAKQPNRAPEPYFVATTKLSQDWSANRAVPHINDEWLDSLLADERFFSMDPMVKVRLLLAGMVAVNQPSYQSNHVARAELQEALGKLQHAAAADADEWVKVMAAATGQRDGRLELDAVMQQSAVVQETIAGLRQQVQESTNQQLLPALEDVYLNTNPSVLNPDSGHFSLRPNPRVQPLSNNVSYAAATPPPPSLQSPRQGDQHGVAFLRPQPKQQLRGLARTSSGSQAAVPGASPAADAGGGLARTKSGLVPKAQKIQMLGEVETKEMQDVLQKSLKAKGHGVAAHVRHEQVPGHMPWLSESGSQQQGHEEAGDMFMEHEGSEDERAAGASAAVAAAGADASAGHAAGRLGRDRAQRAGRFGAAASAATGFGAAAGFGSTAPVTDAQIDELFDDSDDDESLPAPAATGVSRSAKALQHHKGEAEDLEVPDELQDDMDVDDAGDEEAGTAAAAGDGAGQAAEDGAGQSGETDKAALVAAKRRRVIVDDDDD